jgi:hypothetical protein
MLPSFQIGIIVELTILRLVEECAFHQKENPTIHVIQGCG